MTTGEFNQMKILKYFHPKEKRQLNDSKGVKLFVQQHPNWAW